MARIEILKAGKVVKQQSVADDKAAAGCTINLGASGQAKIKLGETKDLGEFQVRIVADAPPPDSSAARSGVPRLDGYTIEKQLGEGGMGVVWQGIQLSTNRRVALKFLGTRAFGSARAEKRFQREVELCAKLEHPNIARIYDSGLRSGVYYYAMQLIRGAPLEEFVSAQQLDQQRILEVMKVICDAVGYAHQQGIIHRDLKPSNILVAADAVPHILDFGLAKSLLTDEEEKHETLTAEGGVSGTPAYMSPEQAAGRLDLVDARSDVYSLGVIAYRQLVGHPPHDLNGSQYDLMRRVVEEEVRAPRQLGVSLARDLEAILFKALAQNPDDRYTDATEFAADIARFLAGEAIHARPATIAYRLRKRLRKHRVLASSAGVVCAATIGIGFLPGGWFRAPIVRMMRSPAPATQVVYMPATQQTVLVPATEPATQTTSLADVVKVKAKIDLVWDDIRRIDGGQGFAQKIQSATELRTTAQGYFDESSYDAALVAYEQVSKSCDELTAGDDQRRKATVARKASVSASAAAKEAGAEIDAADLWKQSQTLAKSAAEQFESADFTQAQSLWEQSTAASDKAKPVAQKAGPIRLARSAYEDLLKKQDQTILDKYGGKDWTSAKTAAKRAATASDPQQVAADYAEAKRLLESAAKLAVETNHKQLARQVQPQVDEHVKNATTLLTDNKLKEAYDEIQQALKLNSTDSKAQKLLAEVEKKDTDGVVLLATVIPEVNLDKVKFSDAIDHVRDQSKANIFVNWRAVEAAGVDKNSPVTAKLTSVTLEKTLQRILDAVGGGTVKLDFAVDKAKDKFTVVISTREDIDRTHVVVNSYNLDDFVAAGGRTQTSSQTMQSMMKLITTTIDPTSWRDNGGTVGSIRQINTNLIISQTKRNQKAIQALLEKLREPLKKGK